MTIDRVLKMANYRYALRWGDHLPNFVSVFSSLLNSECLVDVTLGAEGKYLQAHKVVLSACSTYFQELFGANPCQHPIVLLKDVAFNDLKTIIQFIYYGEVSVRHENLNGVLKTAKLLEIKGLVDMPITMISDDSTLEELPSESSISVKRKRLQSSGETGSSGSTEEIEVVCPPIRVSDVSDEEIKKHDEHKVVFRDERTSDSQSVHKGSLSFSRNSSEDSRDNRCETGRKRGRILVRQPHAINRTAEEEECPMEAKRTMTRQRSDPGDGNTLTVPSNGAHLKKQNSDSALPPHSHHDTSSSSSSTQNDLRFLMQEPRSSHCPILRPGPALGCNYCWNTIDNHGRVLRRKTKYHCPECRTNLCIVPCFQDYHDQKIRNEQDNDEYAKECRKAFSVEMAQTGPKPGSSK